MRECTHLRTAISKGQESSIGSWAMLSEGIVQVQGIRYRALARQGCGEAQLIAFALIQGILARLHIPLICGPRAV